MRRYHHRSHKPLYDVSLPHHLGAVTIAGGGRLEEIVDIPLPRLRDCAQAAFTAQVWRLRALQAAPPVGSPRPEVPAV